MNLFEGRLKAKAQATSPGPYVTGDNQMSDPYAVHIAQARNRLDAARLAHQASGEHLDACCDELSRLESMQQLHQLQLQRTQRHPDEAPVRDGVAPTPQPVYTHSARYFEASRELVEAWDHALAHNSLLTFLLARSRKP